MGHMMQMRGKGEYPPPRREESRRLVQGGREGAANITLELRAEPQ